MVYLDFHKSSIGLHHEISPSRRMWSRVIRWQWVDLEWLERNRPISLGRNLRQLVRPVRFWQQILERKILYEEDFWKRRGGFEGDSRVVGLFHTDLRDTWDSSKRLRPSFWIKTRNTYRWSPPFLGGAAPISANERKSVRKPLWQKRKIAITFGEGVPVEDIVAVDVGDHPMLPGTLFRRLTVWGVRIDHHEGIVSVWWGSPFDFDGRLPYRCRCHFVA